MYGNIKNLDKFEVAAYSCSLFPLKKIGPFKFWVDADAEQDIREGKIAGIAHVKNFKEVKIKIPTIGYKGRTRITPEIVLSQLDRSDFIQFQAYSVKVGEPVCVANKYLSAVAPDYYNATVTLFQTGAKPKKLILKKYDLPCETKKNDKTQNSKQK